MVLDHVPSAILIIGSVICVIGGGLAAGLTIGIMSLDMVGLELLIESGDPKEASYARKLAPIRKKGNLLLCTLLLTNTVFNELLPLFIDHIDGVNAAVALILPTVTVMIFGEIIPQSICARYGLVIGAHCVWLVRTLQLIFFPIAYPMAYLLDKILGEELGNIYSHKQLKGLIDIHSHKRHGALTDVETTLLKGALDFSHKKAEDVMVPLEEVFMVDVNAKVDAETLNNIWQSGRSRIPVCENQRNNIIGMLFAKDLLVVRAEDALPVRTILTFYGQPILKVWADQHLDAIFTDFKSGKCHLAIVQRVNEGHDSSDPFYEPVGIVTLEDVMEELIQDEILDENDQPGSHGKRSRPSISSFIKGRSRPLPEQVAAIVLYLSRSVDIFKPHFMSDEILTRLVAACGCMDVVASPEKEVLIYTRGQPATSFTLILSGKFEVLNGDEKIKTEMGPWCFLGLPSLSNPSYRPDYSAKLITPSAQLFVVSAANYKEAVAKHAGAQSPRSNNVIAYPTPSPSISPSVPYPSPSSASIINSDISLFEKPSYSSSMRKPLIEL